MNNRRDEAWMAFEEMVSDYLDRIYHARAMLVDTDGEEVREVIDDMIQSKTEKYKNEYDNMSSMALHIKAIAEMLEHGAGEELLEELFTEVEDEQC